MFLKKRFALAAMLVLALASPIAFGVTDFSGTWTLDGASRARR